MSNAPMSNVVIDGVINASEWVDADWEIDFYLDVDNTPDWNGKINVDGNNKLYIGEDSTNLYLGLDLCSDQSFNETGEWIGVWLNTANRVFENYFEWADFFNNGTETLLNEVDNDQPWKYYSNTVSFFWEYVNDDSEYVSSYGTIDGNFNALRTYLGGDFNITSEIVGSDELYWIDFSVDLTKWYALEDDSDHRMFEIKIPKSELEHYDPDAHLGIIVGGYGTMTFANKNYWVYSPHNSNIRQVYNENYYYYNMSGLIIPAVPGGAVSGYSVVLVIGVISVCSIIIVKKKFK